MIRFLLRLYPAAWRKEYGEEFADVLAARPLTVNAFANVLGNASWQRLRYTPLWLWSGVLQLISFVALMLAYPLGLLPAQSSGPVFFSVWLAAQVATGLWITVGKFGNFPSGIAGTMKAALFWLTPLMILMLFPHLPPDFPNRALAIHTSRIHAGRNLVDAASSAALLGCLGAVCGLAVKRFKRRVI